MVLFVYFIGLFYFATADEKEFILYQDDPNGIVIGDVNGITMYGDPDCYEKGEISNKLQFQCLEFCERYLFVKYGIKNLPPVTNDCAFNCLKEWDGIQGLKAYYNGTTKILPKVGDILVFDKTATNPYGHVAVPKEINTNFSMIFFGQQNWPKEPVGHTKFHYNEDKTVIIEDYYNYKLLGWLTITKEIKDNKEIIENNTANTTNNKSANVTNKPVNIKKLISTGPDDSKFRVKQTFIVDPRYSWTDTGIDVYAGEKIIIKTTGQVVYAPKNGYYDAQGLLSGFKNGQAVTWDWNIGRYVTADGRAVSSCAYFDSINAPQGALIGKINESAVIYIGTEFIATLRLSGRLYLGINDTPDVLLDNSGYWTVEVIVLPAEKQNNN